MGKIQSHSKGVIVWILGNTSLLKRCSSSGTDFLEKWSVCQPWQCLRGTWRRPLVTCFYLVSPEAVKQLDWAVVGHFKMNSHILCIVSNRIVSYRIVSYRILFYSVTIRVIIKCVQRAFCTFPTSFSCHSLLEKSILLFA